MDPNNLTTQKARWNIYKNSENGFKYPLKNKIKNEILYGALERLSNKIRRRRLHFTGHCLRREDEVVSDLVLWQPTHRTRRRVRPLDSYIKTLESDIGLRENDL